MSEQQDRPARPAPDPSSWVDLAGRWLERLPVPTWLTLVLTGVVVALIETLLVTSSGAAVQPFTLYFSLAGLYALGLILVLQRAAARAFEDFRPSLPAGAHARAEELRCRLVSMPARGTAVASVAGVGVGTAILLASGPLSEQVRTAGLGESPAAMGIHVVLYAFNWAATGALAYRVAHQSRAIDQLYGLADVDLFQPAPLYAFARLSALSVAGLAVMFYAPVLLVPGVGGTTIWVVRAAVGAVLGVLFVWPLWGVHVVLADAHERLVARNADRRRLFFDAFHERLRNEGGAVTDEVRNEIDLLEREQRTLAAISTWPWPTGLVPAVLGAIVLPLVVSLLISFAQQLIGI